MPAIAGLLFLFCGKLMKMQLFARYFSIFIVISPIIRAKHHTAVHHVCLHGMLHFYINSTQCQWSKKTCERISYMSFSLFRPKQCLVSFRVLLLSYSSFFLHTASLVFTGVEWRCGLAMRILSVRPSVRQTRKL